MSQDVLIRARGLGRRFAGRQVVDALSLDLRRGEVLGLLGPNGAGKTTTLRMLCGALAPSRGTVEIGGHDMATQPRQAKAQLGYLPDVPPLHPELSVDEYLAYCARLHALPRAEQATATQRARAACGLDGVARQIIGTLSKGYQQRVGLAQAILHRPAVIILDEPTVGLDPNQMRQIRALIRSLAREHAIILSSHLLGEIQAVCDRAVIMFNGRLVHDAELDTMHSRPASSLLLRLNQAPDMDPLRQLPGVDEVSRESADTLRIGLDDSGVDPRPALLRLALEQDWGLRELREDRPSLEQLFEALTA